MTIIGWRKSSHSMSNGDCVEVGSWRTSSYSTYNGNCLEAGNWRTSSRCASTECAEVGTCGHGVAIRDSTDCGGPVLTFGGGAWGDFLYGIRQGAYLVSAP